jgi:hypothetical protein
MIKKILFPLAVLYFGLSITTNAQVGFQIGADGTCIWNSNPNSLVFPFTPIINYEIGLAYKAQINDKLSYKIELGYANKGAMQSGGSTTKSFVKNSLGYLYGMFGAQFQFAEGWNVQLAVHPSYLVLYKVYDKGIVQNLIGNVARRYKVDAPASIGITKMVGKLNEFTILYANSVAPFAAQKTVFPSVIVEKFYHMQLALIYTFYLPSKTIKE